MMAAPNAIAEAFRLLQAGDARAALEASRRVAEAEPGNARARLAQGIALRMLGHHGEALEALQEAARRDPADPACAYEAGVVHQLDGRLADAVAHFDRAHRLRPGFVAAPFAAALARAQMGLWDEAIAGFRAVLAARPRQPEAMLNLAHALQRSGRHGEADAAYVQALAANPHHFATLKAFGQYSAARGNFRRAASLFADAARTAPEDEAMPLFLAQVELLLGRWGAAWTAYAKREPRRRFASALAARGGYRLPPLRELSGRDVTLVGEQGLGDAVFFLRWAPRLRAEGARLRFAGHPRLHPLLARSGLFEGFDEAFDPAVDGARIPLLVGDLPSIFPGEDPLAVPSLRVDPDPAALARWRDALAAAGPRPWTGVTWRAGTPSSVVAHALYKSVPPQELMASLAAAPGTVVALQRGLAAGEIEAASRARGAPVADFSRGSEALEDALALVSLIDRHVGVSNTNMHLAALAGATAEVLEPFPPEWRWRLEGESPWFPGFRVHRATIEGGWAPALAAVQRATPASSGRQ